MPAGLTPAAQHADPAEDRAQEPPPLPKKEPTPAYTDEKQRPPQPADFAEKLPSILMAPGLTGSIFPVRPPPRSPMDVLATHMLLPTGPCARPYSPTPTRSAYCDF